MNASLFRRSSGLRAAFVLLSCLAMAACSQSSSAPLPPGTVVGDVPRSALDNSAWGSSPQSPRTLSVYVAGTTAFLADHAGGVAIVDVSNPFSPQVLKIIEAPLRSSSYLSRALAVYATSDANYLVAVFDADGAVFYDLTDRLNPRKVHQEFTVDNAIGGIDPAGLPDYPYLPLPPGKSILWPGAVAGAGNIVYVGGDRAILVFDISDRNAPRLLTAVPTRGSSTTDLHLEGNLLFCSALGDQEIFDVSDPASPSLLATYLSAVPGNYIGTAATDNVMAISRGADGMEFLDVSDPSAPFLIGAFPRESQGVDSAPGGYFYAATADSMTVYRASAARGTVEELASYRVVTNYAMNVAVAGDYAYVADKYDGLKIVKIR